MRKKSYLFHFTGVTILVLSSMFFGSQKAQAANSTVQPVVINELMWAGSSKSTTDGSDEWIELYNQTDKTVDISGWQLTKISSGKETLMLTIPANSPTQNSIIDADGYYLISHYDLADAKTILNVKPDYVAGTKLTLSNTNLQISMYNEPWSAENPPAYVDRAGNGGKPFLGENDTANHQNYKSMERSDPLGDGNLPESWHTATTSVGFIEGATEMGTPGTKNSEPINQPPSVPQLATPKNGEEINSDKSVNFTWQASQDPEGATVEYSLYLNCDGAFGDEDLIASELAQTSYKLDLPIECPIYYWQVLATDGENIVSSETFKFMVKKPIYSDNIVINELYPDPSTTATDEWIELANVGETAADISGWTIEDLSGSTHSYLIPAGTIIPGGGYKIFKRTDTGITLNNDSDGVKLTRPDGVSYQTPYFSSGQKGWSFARTAEGGWSWTDSITPESANVIDLPAEKGSGNSTNNNTDQPINSTPINIKTGELSGHDNELVIIQGGVTSTSGDTFYIDDGSGAAKVYIQEKTGINKPPMHKGDIFQIIGIVDLYGSTWRLLPQKQDDVQLIEAALKVASTPTPKAKKASTAKTTTAKLTAAKTTAQARAPTVAGTADPSVSSGNSTKASTPWWIQLLKMILGLSIVLLIVVIIKIRSIKKTKPLGGDFGDET